MSSLMADFLRQTGGTAVIDGGLATELERHGADLNDPLWSAKCLFSSPHLIRQVHLDYLENGADIIITASYQATIQGFKAKGYSDEESEGLLRRSVEIACEAREVMGLMVESSNNDLSWLQHQWGAMELIWPTDQSTVGIMVMLSLVETLKDFHRRRVQILAESGADLLAFETVPNKLEAEAYAQLLEEEDIKIPAWFSFNSKDGVNVVSGDSLMECGSIAESCNKVVAVGINCTPPRFIHGLIVLLKKVTTKPIVIYPNSGETYDADLKEWVQNTGVTDEDFISYVNKWCELGASLVGGCCRTTPATIRKIYRTLSGRQFAILATK
ncbi:Selenocysteine methyltransferase [Spatholobus suberectus]|nr:Selenocysteine methyltransferase [Spatholobus suberectus]